MKKIASFLARIGVSFAAGAVSSVVLSKLKAPLIVKILAAFGFMIVGGRFAYDAAEDAKLMVDGGRELIREFKEED